MHVLDLFSGIGGFSLGLERAGMRTIQFVELDPFCRAVIAQHWPDVPCHDDIRTFTAPEGFADVICGGFPCQDISVAGKGAGLAGARSGLWSEFARLIREIRPRFAIVENVSGLLSRGLGEVLGDLAALGYDAQWHCVPASHVGAPHRRDRIWIVAYPGSEQHQGDCNALEGTRAAKFPQADISDSLGEQLWEQSGRRGGSHGSDSAEPRDDGAQSAMAHSARRNADGARLAQRESQCGDHGEELPSLVGAGWWIVEPNVGRVAHGIPTRVDRLRSLGNAVVPQIPEIIGRAIMRAL